MAAKRVLIVGGVAAGASCAARLRRLDEEAEIFIYERGSDVSFANCGLPYYLGGLITSRQRLLMSSPERFRDLLRIEVRTRHEVRSIDRQRKVIREQNLRTGQEREEPYDVLVLTTGAAPVRPALPGIDLPGVFSLRTLDDADAIRAWLEQHKPLRAVVVGGGYIGLEMVENLCRRDIEVTLLEMADQLMPQTDPEMVAPVYAELERHNVEVHLRTKVSGFERGADDSICAVTENGQRFPADLVLLCLGVKPDVKLAADAGLEIGPAGGIRVDEQMRTSDPNIFAAGDAVEVRHFVTGQPVLCPLAGPASRQGRVVADVICGRPARYRGTQGTAAVGVFDVTLAMTGATEKQLVAAGMDYQKSYTHSPHHATYYPGAERIALKLLFEPKTGRLLGAQAAGKAGVDKRIDVLAMAIQKEGTVFDLEEAELAYAPQYGSAKDPINIAGFVAGNILRGDVDPAYWEEWLRRDQAGQRPLTLDVRPPADVATEALPDTVRIPLGELRSRLNELPRDQEIWVHCMVGQTAYYATRLLRQHGFKVKNLSGGLTTYKMLPRGNGQ